MSCNTNLANIGNIEKDPVFLSQKGKPGGVATLDANGKVPLSQVDISAIFTERDPVYRADRGVAFGCATLDGSARVVREQLGSGTFDTTTFLRGDGSWAVPPGGSGSVPEGWKLTGTDVSLLTSTSKVVVGGLPTIAKFGVVGDNPADITSIIRAAAAQVANILEIQNSTGTVLIAIAPTNNGQLIVGDAAPLGAEKFRVTDGTVLIDFTDTAAFEITQTGGGLPALIVDTTNTRVGVGVAPAFPFDVLGNTRITGNTTVTGGKLLVDFADVVAFEVTGGTGSALIVDSVNNRVGVNMIPGAFSLDVAGDTRITGKLTVTGAIDPTSVLLSGGTALFYESNDGSTAPLSGPATGRLRYNNILGVWQKSTQGGAYVDLVSGSGNAYRMVKWISTAETADGPVESDAGNTFLAPNIDDAILLGTSSARFSRISASDIIGIFLSQGDAEYSSRLLFDRLAMGDGGGTGVPDVSLRRTAASTFAISDDLGGGDVTIGVVSDALFLDAKNGSNAAVSGPTTGRLRYNNTYGYWEQSTLGNPYVPVGDVRDIFRYSMLHNMV